VVELIVVAALALLLARPIAVVLIFAANRVAAVSDE
jgi:hypothetical protein